MALITISGYPCSGKSTRAAQIATYLRQRLQDPSYTGPLLKVSIISDESLNIPRSVYDSSRSEKPARGKLFTTIQREMNQDTVLIVDAPNYIKGFRYQIYCAAKELKIRMCTVYVIAKPEDCIQWNSVRSSEESYAPQTLENMITRYEEPNSMVRWDSPLISILWSEEGIPGEDIWKAVTEGTVLMANVGTQAVPKAAADALSTLEHTTTSVVSAIMSHQSASGVSGGQVNLSLPSTRVAITLPSRTLSLSELQRLKRQFVTVHRKATTLGTTEKGSVNWDEENVATKFVVYLEENLKP